MRLSPKCLLVSITGETLKGLLDILFYNNSSLCFLMSWGAVRGSAVNGTSPGCYVHINNCAGSDSGKG